MCKGSFVTAGLLVGFNISVSQNGAGII